MGVGSSREVEEQLEAALSLLDAARTKQESQAKDAEQLQSRIQMQATALLEQEGQLKAKSVHLIQEQAPLSKRVVLALLLLAPLAVHKLRASTELAVAVTDPMGFVQGLGLVSAFVVLYRARHTRWRRIRPERIAYGPSAEHRNGGPASASELGRRRADSESHPPPPVTDGGRPRKATSADLASEEELAVLEEVKRNLRREPRPPLLVSHEPLLDVQLIRFLREHGASTGL